MTDKDGENYFSKIGKAGGKKSVAARRERGNIQRNARVILETQFEPKRNKDFKKFLEQIGIDPNDKMTVLNGIMAVFAGKALDGDIVAAKFLLDVAGYSLSAKERLAKIKLLERMANPEDAESLAKVKPPVNLDEIDAEARKLGIYGC